MRVGYTHICYVIVYDIISYHIARVYDARVVGLCYCVWMHVRAILVCCVYVCMCVYVCVCVYVCLCVVMYVCVCIICVYV